MLRNSEAIISPPCLRGYKVLATSQYIDNHEGKSKSALYFTLRPNI